MATQTPESVVVDSAPRIIADPEAMQELRDGLGSAASYFHVEELVELEGELPFRLRDHPAVIAWEDEVVDPAIAEIAPAVADLLTAAIEKRLPWTWEPIGIWNEPGRDYFSAAQEALGLADADLEEIRPEHARGNVPQGEYPNRDRVYARAWELREVDEAEEGE